jgi:hypothetical protein
MSDIKGFYFLRYFWLLAIRFWLSAFGYRLSAIRFWLSAFGYPLLAIRFWFLAASL